MKRNSLLFGAFSTLCATFISSSDANATSISVRYGFTATNFIASGVGMAAPSEVSGEVAVTFTPLQDLGLINGPNPFVFDDIDLVFAGMDYGVADLATVIGVRNSRLQFNNAAQINGGDFNGRFEITGENCFQSTVGVSIGCGADDFFLRFTDRGLPGPTFVPSFEQFVASALSIATPTQSFFSNEVSIERLSASIDGTPIATQPTTTVPVPASALLLLSALAGFAGIGAASKRRKA